MGNRKKNKKQKDHHPKPATAQKAEKYTKPSILEPKIVLTEGLIKALSKDEIKRVIQWLALTHNTYASLFLEDTTIDDIIIKIAGKDYLINRRKSIKASWLITLFLGIVIAILFLLKPEEAVKKLLDSTSNLYAYLILAAMTIGAIIKTATYLIAFFRTWLIEPPFIRRLRTLNSLVDSGIIAAVIILIIEITGGRLYVSYFLETIVIPAIGRALPTVKNFISAYWLSVILKILDWVFAGVIGHYSVLAIQKIMPVKIKEEKK